MLVTVFDVDEFPTKIQSNDSSRVTPLPLFRLIKLVIM